MNRQKLEHSTLRWILFAKTGAGVVLALAVAGGWWLHSRGIEIADLTTALRGSTEPRFEWHTVDGPHWQALAPRGSEAFVGEATDVTDAREADGQGCPRGMVRVKGNYHPDPTGDGSGAIERMQDAACTDWVNKDFPARCRTFDEERLAIEVAALKTTPMDFCMDRYEYPNVAGQNPIILVTFNESVALCKKANKRICNESEWTFACEGEQARPYPYGYTRDETACVIDRTWRTVAEGALSSRGSTAAQQEIDRLWQGEPSGSRGACRSPFGVYDMTGNVDEWTRSVRSSGYASVLKGGYWGPVRARCRPATRAHSEDFVDYQQGFRCCADADTSVAPPGPRDVADAAAAPVAGDAAIAALPIVSDASVLAAQAEEPTADLLHTSAFPDDRSDDELRALARAHASLLRCSLGASAQSLPDGARDGFGIALSLGLVGIHVLRARRSR
ncbi:MAG: formylglycine-generating enzyme family protein [Polyangiaceae bacterium]|nr:formylglycine-generating enzyme family protein [Polyangiaceae bacterium]